MRVLKNRAILARKAYASRLNEAYRVLRAHKAGDTSKHPGGINLMEKMIGAYFAMLQAERDEEAGRVVDGEPLDKLITAFDEWVASRKINPGPAHLLMSGLINQEKLDHV
jgi:hypothetical protein